VIKKLNLSKLDEVMKIWLDTNIESHNFIPREYWINNFDLVKQMLPSADIYVFEENNIIKGFIGIIEQSYIAGIFIKKEFQREGIGYKLIEYCKLKYKHLELDVFQKNEGALKFYYKNNFKVLDKKINEETQEFEYTMFFESSNLS
jgi:putative acetyltransferase